MVHPQISIEISFKIKSGYLHSTVSTGLYVCIGLLQLPINCCASIINLSKQTVGGAVKKSKINETAGEKGLHLKIIMLLNGVSYLVVRWSLVQHPTSSPVSLCNQDVLRIKTEECLCSCVTYPQRKTTSTGRPEARAPLRDVTPISPSPSCNTHT